MEKDKIVFKGSHPDSLYRVPTESVGADRVTKLLRTLRWPIALVAVCIALTVFVYFLMPDNIDRRVEANGTYTTSPSSSESKHNNIKEESAHTDSYGTKTAEIDFYDNENNKIDFSSVADTATETIPRRKLPVEPVFPTHITPEVQYGNERVDTNKLRSPKVLEDSSLPNSTMKPHITHKPEKPLAVYIKDGNDITTESITRAETINDFANYGEKQTTKKVTETATKITQKEQTTMKSKPLNVKQYLVTEPRTPPEIQELQSRQPANIDVNFTSGHSKLFGISIEDAERMKSTTQSSLYNTRVSPTLPTWRDGDDTTTKKYPVNVNFEVPQCRSTRLAMCRGVLPYDLAGSPVKIRGLEATALLPQIEYLVATNCSDRLSHFACALMEPECNPPPYPVKKPCHNFCKAIVDSCEGLIPRELLPMFNCSSYLESNCVAARTPCFPRELPCRDGTCIPRDWICDGVRDCSTGDDEATCTACGDNEYRCDGGSCIPQRWVCDGYADCPDGQEEADCGPQYQAGDPGDEGAASAPAPAVHRPNRLPEARDLHRTGESDNSKELLITSDSNNALKRNFTRRPSPSRLTPYTRKVQIERIEEPTNQPKPEQRTTQKPQYNESTEDVNVGDLDFFQELKKVSKDDDGKEQRQRPGGKSAGQAAAPAPSTRLDRTISKLEKVIDGAALMKKAIAEEQGPESAEINSTLSEEIPKPGPSGISSHVSPCPSGELRCVDGRCITLAQLCDGTIDCTDHADEDNCYT